MSSLEILPDIRTRSEFEVESNACGSTLLSLPPEIRNLIFEYTLGGNTLHVRVTHPKKRKLQHATVSVCLCGIDDQKVAMEIRQLTENTNVLTYLERHITCNLHYHTHAHSSSALHLNLLQTCRQVYNEAALLPFYCNAFECNSLIALQGLISRLTPHQLNALTSLTITDPLSFDDIQCARKLTGLKALTIYAGFPEEFLTGNQRIWYDARRKDKFTRVLTRPFAGLPLSRVTACVFQDFQVRQRPLPSQPAQVKPDIHGPVATEIERIILENASKETKGRAQNLMQE